jgi:hypothetical protein
MDPRLMLYIFV